MDRTVFTCAGYAAAVLLAGACMMNLPPVAAQNLVPNGDFETFDDEHGFPANWGKHWSYTGEYQPINDIARSYEGFGSLSLSQSGPNASEQWVTVGSARISPQGNRRYALSVWAKGRGQLATMVYLYGGGRYLQAPATGTVTPADFTAVQSDQWKQYHFEVVIPENALEPEGQSNAAVDQFEVLFNVKKGPVFLDNVELYLADNKPAPVERRDRIFKRDKSPLVTFTPMPAPVIDGVVNEDEWSAASGTTGFFEQGGIALADRQTTVNTGFDDRTIYISFRSDQDALLIKEVPPGPNAQFVDTVEGFEVWLQPPGQGFYQLLVMPGGATLRKIEGEQPLPWGPGIQYASKVVDSGEMHGGILSLGKKTWSGEIAIPFADLGVNAPADGETWRLNFCRDFSVQEGSARQPADWTTWAPLKGQFSDVKGFGYGQFSRAATPFKLHALGDLKNGSLGIAGATGARVEVQASVVMDDYPDKEIVGRSLDTEQAGAFGIDDVIRTRSIGATRMTLFLGARDTATGQLVAQTVAPFTILPSFHIEPQLLYGRSEIEVGISANRLSGLPKNAVLELQVAKVDGGEVLASDSQPIDPANLRFITHLGSADIPPGDYFVKGFVKDAAGEIIASTAEPISIPDRPSWYDNTLGITDEIPVPFTPVEVDGHNVGVTQRQYTLQDSGLPAQVIALGKEMFTGPAVVRAVVDGKPVEWTFQPLERVAQKPGEVTWKLNGSSDQLELTGTLRMEYDGFGLWDVRFKPVGSVTIDALSIDFPVARENALFAKGDGSAVASLMQDRFTAAPGREDVVVLGNKVTQWGSWTYSRKGWIWGEQFFNEIYVGSDERGFSFMTETNRNVRGPKYAEFIEHGDSTTLMRINLVSEPTTLTEELPYVYFFQTTPVKPEPEDPRRWHVTYDPSTIYALNADGYRNEAGLEFLRACFVGMAYYDIMPDGYPRWLHDAAESRHALKYFQDLGMKVTTNLWYSAVADSLPEYKIFGREWAALPSYGWPSPNANLTSACLGSSYQQFMIWCTERLLNELGFDGVYTDATAVPCHNGRHNCGYVGADGERHSDLNMLGTRAFVKRMYSILKEGGQDRLNFSHSGESTSTAAFVDIRTHGEEICQEEHDHYRRISPDYFRAKYAQNEYGVVYTVQAIFHYKWRAVGEQVPLSEVLMMCLVHRTQPTLAYNLEMIKVWELFDPWWTSAKFVPYWKEEAPATTNDPVNILASTFLKADEKQALVIVSNWSYDDVNATVTLDKNQLGFTPTKVTLVDNATNAETPVDANNPSFAIKSRDYKVLLVK